MNFNNLPSLVLFVACVTYVNSCYVPQGYSPLLDDSPPLSAPLCGSPLSIQQALQPSQPQGIQLSPAPSLSLSPAYGAAPCGIQALPPTALGYGDCGLVPQAKTIAISPTLGLISKLKAKMCAKLCGGLDPLAAKLGKFGCAPAALPPQLYL